MKTNNIKSNVICYIVIAVAAIFNNFILIHLNTGVAYPASALSSDICVQEEKYVNGGPSGYLTFGPYIRADEEKLQVDIYYTASVNGNSYDIYSDKNKLTFKAGVLPADKSVVTVEADITVPVDDLEIRTFYNGDGEMRVEKLVVTKGQESLTAIIVIYDIIIISVFAVNTVLTGKKLKKNDSPRGEKP